jgi:hypothetical protein
MEPTPRQRVWRERFEALIGLAAPFLDLVLDAGDRASRLLGQSDDYYPVPPAADALELEEARRAGRRERVEAGD